MYKYYGTQSIQRTFNDIMHGTRIGNLEIACNTFFAKIKGRCDGTSSRKGPARCDSSKRPLNPLRSLGGRLLEVRLFKEFEKPQKSRKMMYAI